MTAEKLYELLGEIDDDIIELAEGHIFERPMKRLLRFAPIAAALLLIVCLSPALMLIFASNGATSGDTANRAEDMRDTDALPPESIARIERVAFSAADLGLEPEREYRLTLSGDRTCEISLSGADIVSLENLTVIGTEEKTDHRTDPSDTDEAIFYEYSERAVLLLVETTESDQNDPSDSSSWTAEITISSVSQSFELNVPDFVRVAVE